MDSSSSHVSTDKNTDLHKQDDGIVTYMDSELYKAASQGKIEPFHSYKQSLHLLLTHRRNTILHIHITDRAKTLDFISSRDPYSFKKDTSFLEGILKKCSLLLVQVNFRDETPLHMAARHGHNDVVKVLINCAKSQHGDVESSGAGAVREMLKMENVDRETALHEAARHNRVGIVTILTEEERDIVYSANEAGETPIYLAAERGFGDAVLKMLENCKSVDYNGPNGRTALHEAVIRNDERTVERILEKNGKILAKKADGQGWTPLHHASHFGWISIVKKLIEFDKSVAYITDSEGKIPLHIAALNESTEVVTYMLSCCPDCHEIVDNRGQNVLHFAVQTQTNHRLFRYLVGPLEAFDGYLPSLDNLINQKDADGNSPLHLLATYCFSNIWLINHPLVDKNAVNKNNQTSLDIVAGVDQHTFGKRGSTLRKMHKANYEKSQRRKIIGMRHTLDESNWNKDDLFKLGDAQVVVATLIATVTFAAGFTLPGGYNGDEGPDEGTAILTRNAAFKAFLVTDTIALILSISAVFTSFFSLLVGNRRKYMNALFIAANLTVIALVSMSVAFGTGIYAVLPSSALRVFMAVIAALFPLVSWFVVKYCWDL